MRRLQRVYVRYISLVTRRFPLNRRRFIAAEAESSRDSSAVLIGEESHGGFRECTRTTRQRARKYRASSAAASPLARHWRAASGVFVIDQRAAPIPLPIIKTRASIISRFTYRKIVCNREHLSLSLSLLCARACMFSFSHEDLAAPVMLRRRRSRDSPNCSDFRLNDYAFPHFEITGSSLPPVRRAASKYAERWRR